MMQTREESHSLLRQIHEPRLVFILYNKMDRIEGSKWFFDGIKYCKVAMAWKILQVDPSLECSSDTVERHSITLKLEAVIQMARRTDVLLGWCLDILLHRN